MRTRFINKLFNMKMTKYSVLKKKKEIMYKGTLTKVHM